MNETFCGAEELKESWDNKSIPDEFLTSFAELFNIKKTSLIPDIDRNPELLDDSGDGDDEIFKNSKTEQLEILKINSLFQMMYYNLHNGRQSTSFHSIYEKCRCKEIITQQNRLRVSVRYNTIKQYRTSLAKYAMLKSSENNVPLPSHFNKEMFTIAAFDNCDHTDRTSRSELSSSHDTVFTLLPMPGHLT